MLKLLKIILKYTLPITFLLYGSLAFGSDDNSKMPFKPGEKLHFKVTWNLIHAGDAVLEVRPIDEEYGEEGYYFLMSAKSTKFVDHIYKVRDKFESYTDINMNHSLFYRKISTGRKKRETLINIDWNINKAQYVKNGKKKEPIDIKEGTFDPLSVFYAYRLSKFTSGEEVCATVTDGKLNVLSIAKIIKKEKIKVPSGEYESYLVELDFKEIGGVFKKSKDADIKIWVTADEMKIPLRFKSKVAVGSFVAELVAIEGI